MDQCEKEFLRPNDMAAILGVSKETLRLWRLRGILPYFRIRNTVRFCRSDVIKCLERFKRNGMV